MKNISKELSYPGIYCIINTYNNKKYIGSSKNIRKRLWEHRSELRHNKHANIYLLRAWNKYGEDKFDFYVIEACQENFLLERELFYIDTLKPEYNLNPIASKPPVTIESKKKLSETRKYKMSIGLIPITNNKPVFLYDLDGNFIREFQSIRKAAKFNNMDPSQIQLCINGKYRQGGGFLWSCSKLLKLSKYIKNTKKPFRKGVIVYNNIELYKFKNAKECADYFNKHIVTIRDAILNKRCFMKKYKIEYIEPCN